MSSRPLPFAAGVLAAILAAVPCRAASPEIPDPALSLPIDGDPGDPPDPTVPCAVLAAACVTGIAGTVPACAACVGVVTCIACAGAGSATVASCLDYSDRCLDTTAHEGDLCRYSNRCETGGLHCINNQCWDRRGTESERCSSDRDCTTGLVCLPDGEMPDRNAGKCWRMRGNGEICGSSAECQTGLVCDPSTHGCRRPTCQEGLTPPMTGCTCTIDASHPGPRGDCPSGYNCDGGRCTQVTVKVCACDGSDPAGTCQSCQPPPVGGGPPPPTFYYYPTCYYFYEAHTYYTCATYGEQTECSGSETEYELVDSFCI